MRVQWSREDEHGWDPKGPPQLLALEGALTDDGRIAAWRTEMWHPEGDREPAEHAAAGARRRRHRADAGHHDRPHQPERRSAVRRAAPGSASSTGCRTSPLRPSNFRAPGKIANCFAVESFTDELAAAAGRDPLEFRLQGLSDPRGVEVIRRAAALIGWQARPSPAPAQTGAGRGFAYIHYKHNESYVAMAMEVEVDRASGAIRVRRVACAHDCGLVINPDALRAQIEGNILQTLSRTLFEEVAFDRVARDERRLGELPDPALPRRAARS